MGGGSETITDIQFVKLLKPGVSDTKAKKICRRSSHGKANIYMQEWKSYKKKYRSVLNARYLSKLGYNETSTGTTYTPDHSLVASYLINKLTLSDASIISANNTYLSIEDKVNYGTQQLVGYDSNTSVYTEDNYDYLALYGYSITYTEVGITFKMLYNQAIKKYLLENYNYDEKANTVTINGSTYTVGTISDNAVNGTYSVDVTKGSTTITLHPPVITITKNYSNTLFDEEVLFVEFTSSNYGTGKRYYMEAANKAPVYSNTVVDFTPIIPLKEDFNIVGDSHNLKMILKKFNLTRKSFLDSLNNDKLDAAYLVIMVDPTVNKQGIQKVIYELLDTVTEFSKVVDSNDTIVGASNISNSITISFSQLSMKLSIQVHSKAKLSKINGDVGKYGSRLDTITELQQAKDGDGNLLYDYQGKPSMEKTKISVMIWWYQLNSSESIEIAVSQLTETYTISGYTIISTLFDSTDNSTKNKEDFRIPIPLNIYNTIKYDEWVEVYEESLNMLAFTVQTVHYEWYQSGPFRAIIQIVGIVLVVISIVSGNVEFTDAIIDAVEITAVAYAIQQVAIAIGGDLGAVFAFVAAVVAVYYAHGTDEFTWTTWLKSASAGLNSMNQVIQHEAALIATQDEAYIKEMKAKMDDLEEKMKKYDDDGIIVNNNLIDSMGSRNPMFNSIESYVNSIVNTEYLVDGSWMYDVTGEVERRNKVYVGV
jgi:hypothetical protein